VACCSPRQNMISFWCSRRADCSPSRFGGKKESDCRTPHCAALHLNVNGLKLARVSGPRLA
jgi:hypothetical protein